MELEKIDEVTKVAAIQASAALSKLINLPVGVDISPANTMRLEDLHPFMNPEEEVIGITAKLSGNLTGMSLLFFPRETALKFCDLLLKNKEKTSVSFSELEISALTEVANIVIGNFLWPFAFPLKLESVIHHAPEFMMDNYKNMIHHFAVTLNMHIHERMMVEIGITLQHFQLKGYLVFMFGMKEMKKALEQ